MRTRRAILLLAAAALSCSSPEPAPGSGSRAPPVAAPPAPPSAGASEAAPTAAEAPDAGVGRQRRPPIAPGRPVLIEFTRAHCLPCEVMAPWLAELRALHAGKIDVLELDLDRAENEPIARFFGARSVPLQVYVDAAGREVARNSGLATKAQMQHRLEALGFVKAD